MKPVLLLKLKPYSIFGTKNYDYISVLKKKTNKALTKHVYGSNKNKMLQIDQTTFPRIKNYLQIDLR